MAENLLPIAAFEHGSNPSYSWRCWMQDFKDYIAALKYAGKSEKTKTTLFRYIIGDMLKNILC